MAKHRTNIYLEPSQVVDLDLIKESDKLDWAKFIRQAIDVAIVRWKMRKAQAGEKKE